MSDTDFPKRLRDFHSRLSTDLQYDFRRILDDFASYYFEIGEIFKMTCIDLIPSKIQTDPQMAINQRLDNVALSLQTTFKPQTKPKTGDPLAEMLATMTPEQQASLRAKLEKK